MLARHLATSRVVETDVTVPIMKTLAYLKPLPGKRERERERERGGREREREREKREREREREALGK